MENDVVPNSLLRFLGPYPPEGWSDEGAPDSSLQPLVAAHAMLYPLVLKRNTPSWASLTLHPLVAPDMHA